MKSRKGPIFLFHSSALVRPGRANKKQSRHRSSATRSLKTHSSLPFSESVNEISSREQEKELDGIKGPVWLRDFWGESRGSASVRHMRHAAAILNRKRLQRNYFALRASGSCSRCPPSLNVKPVSKFIEFPAISALFTFRTAAILNSVCSTPRMEVCEIIISIETTIHLSSRFSLVCSQFRLV